MPSDSLRHDATAWFDALYAAADRNADAVPWAGMAPCPWLPEFLADRPGPGGAVVVGCGLGDDAEAVAAAGYETVAFDISSSAVEWCRDRFPSSPVDYRVADLLDLPADWDDGFDLVVEVRTVQSLPPVLWGTAIDAVASLVANDGTAFVLALARAEGTIPTGPPWPLSPSEMQRYLDSGLHRAADLSAGGQFVWVLERSRHE
jgi:hypothetical protein